MLALEKDQEDVFGRIARSRGLSGQSFCNIDTRTRQTTEGFVLNVQSLSKFFDIWGGPVCREVLHGVEPEGVGTGDQAI